MKQHFNIVLLHYKFQPNSDILHRDVVITPTQSHIQNQLQRKHEELQQLIIQQQRELQRVSEQLQLARYGILPSIGNTNLPIAIRPYTQYVNRTSYQTINCSHPNEANQQQSAVLLDNSSDHQSIKPCESSISHEEVMSHGKISCTSSPQQSVHNLHEFESVHAHSSVSDNDLDIPIEIKSNKYDSSA